VAGALPADLIQMQTCWSGFSLEENEMQALLNTVDLKSHTGVRDKALLLLLYNTGARVSEIVELKLEDLLLALARNENFTVAFCDRCRRAD
jgi:site-specific recombinase XerD